MNKNYSQFEKSLLEFLKSNEKSVAVINGDWGIGKTYIWQNNIIPKYLQKNSDKKNDYAYVSLFGVNSVQEIKNKLLTKYSKHIGKIPDKILGFGIKSFADIGLSIAFDTTIKDKVICIDDLERKGDALQIKDVFGIVDELRTQKSCKFVIIHNFQELEEKEQKEFKKYIEKVSDIEIEFKPSYFDLAEIIFNKRDEYNIGLISSYLEQVQLKNLRVIKRSKDLFDKIWVEINEKELLNLKENLLKIVIFLVGNYYEANKVNDGKEVKERLEGKLSSNNDDLDSIIQQEYDFQEKFGDLQFISPSLTVSINKFLSQGCFELDELRAGIHETQKNYQVDSAKRKYSEIYKKYYYNFSKNKQLFIQELINVIKSNVTDINVRDYSSALDLLDELGQGTTKLIEICIDEYESTISEWNLEDKMREWHFIPNKKWLIKLKNVIQRNKPSLKIEPVLMTILNESYTNQIHENFLLKLNEDKIYKWLTTSANKDLVLMVRGVLLKYRNQQGKIQQVGVWTENVLKRIAREDKFNSIKIRTLYKIEN